MQLSVTEREQLYAILEKYDQNPKVQQMREFIQHGDVTTYQHCKNVVLVSCWLNHRLHLGADETSLAVGAFLHDFYLYVCPDGLKRNCHDLIVDSHKAFGVFEFLTVSVMQTMRS